MLKAVLFVLLISTALARNDGRYDNSPNREWFEAQLIPNGPDKGKSCCSTADGARAQEEIRGQDYWVTFSIGDKAYGPMPVPHEVVLRPPDFVNKAGVPIVWWFNEKGEIKIRCYAPGPGT